MPRRRSGRFPGVPLLLGPLAWTLLAGCERAPSDQVQGYLEGEFVYVASPRAGQLEQRPAQRGRQVKKGDLLFALEKGSETAERQQAERRLAEAQAQLADARKGQRPSELEALEAQLKQARTAAEFSEGDAARLERAARGSVSVHDVDLARAARDQDRQRVARLEAELATARLGARTDALAALEAEVKSREAALALADWNLSQKRQAAPQGGEVFDTFYEPGEWVAAGRPVAAILPPQNIKVRAFVPETRIADLHRGDAVSVRVDGLPSALSARVSFISPRPEYTPPVIYSRDSRSKLVFMIEAVFEPKDAARLHPGQPVDVRLGAPGPATSAAAEAAASAKAEAAASATAEAAASATGGAAAGHER